mmetsp:Transcript_73608/g.142359  ORF Transcript_73608/g.142359 Transcript_73608/m.142359 type:complete len:431 (-) Transcript_73608:170-1462(-)
MISCTWVFSWLLWTTLVAGSMVGDCEPSSGDGVCSGVSSSLSDQDASVSQRQEDDVSTPAMRPAIRAILHGNLTFFDQDFDQMLTLLNQDGFQEFAHSRDAFSYHLQQTFGMLGAWEQPQDVQRLGLFHSAYSGDLLIFHFLSDWREEDRAQLRSVVGEDTEALIYLFGTTKRGNGNDTLYASPGAVLPSDGVTVDHRFKGIYDTLHLDSRVLAKILLVSIADVFDQMLQINAWRDSHQHEKPSSLYPGQARPDLGMHWMSRVCAGIKDFLEVVPPIFGSCTQELAYSDEVAARDAYWTVILEEQKLSHEERESALRTAIAHNPFIAEPHLVLCQVLFQQGKFGEAAREARTALDIFYVWANCWDKRLPFRQWIAFTRIMLMRSQRMAKGQPSLPFSPDKKSNVRKGMHQFGGAEHDLNVVSIKDMLADM